MFINRKADGQTKNKINVFLAVWAFIATAFSAFSMYNFSTGNQIFEQLTKQNINTELHTEEKTPPPALEQKTQKQQAAALIEPQVASAKPVIQKPKIDTELTQAIDDYNNALEKIKSIENTLVNAFTQLVYKTTRNEKEEYIYINMYTKDETLIWNTKPNNTARDYKKRTEQLENIYNYFQDIKSGLRLEK